MQDKPSTSATVGSIGTKSLVNWRVGEVGEAIITGD
jgi:hypothetical protein